MSQNDFGEFLAGIREKIESAASISSEKDINYGHQFTVLQGGAKVSLNVYNGKKGRRLVWSGDSSLQEKLRAAVEGRAAAAEACALPESGGQWAGSDESGKGDFFGPLAVAAVVADGGTEARLRQAGVKDCKLLTDKKILELEEVIKSSVIDYCVLVLKPKIYNMRYEQVAAQGGKLNRLLGLGHIAALSQVLERCPECRSALIDQFTASDENIHALGQKFPGRSFRQQPKAESDLAVAAASVLARAAFLHNMEELAKEAGEPELPKGGGEAATACARRLAGRLGREALRNFVKLHFANYRRV